MIQKVRNSISLKLGFQIFVISAIISIVTTFLQVSSEFYQDINSLKLDLDNALKSSAPAFSNAVWTLDQTQMSLITEGILINGNFTRVAVHSNEKIIFEANSRAPDPNESLISNEIRLHYSSDGRKDVDLGILMISASQKEIWLRTLNQFWWILLSQVIRTFVVSIAIFYVTEKIVLSRLRSVVQFFKRAEVQSGAILKMPKDLTSEDEIASLIGESNHFIDKINAASTQLEAEVEARTKVELEKKHADEKAERIEALNKQLEKQKNELVILNSDLESFSYSVAHDLRSPLRAINGFSKILLEDIGPKLEGEPKEYLDRIVAASIKMGSLIEDILKLSKIAREQVRITNVDLTSLAQELVTKNLALFPNSKYDINIQTGLNVKGDKHLLEIALDNLINNALKYSSKTQDAKIEFFYSESDKAYCVRDNGAGFESSLISKLFTPFTRLHSQAEFPGTGIGLSIVFKVIKKHDGQVWAKGELDQGCEVFFTLPT